jgi:hypothetical protein
VKFNGPREFDLWPGFTKNHRMKLLMPVVLGTLAYAHVAAAAVHVWERQELTFHASGAYTNPYAQLKVWVDLKGPGFARRCYGFWDGSNVFRVRVLATAPGTWTWTSGSDPVDAGLHSRSGRFEAIGWTESEKSKVATRRGFIQASANGHAFQYADGTPFGFRGTTTIANAR